MNQSSDMNINTQLQKIDKHFSKKIENKDLDQDEFIQKCQNNNASIKSLPRNIRLLIYSFLSINKSYKILIQLNKSEKESIPYSKNQRFPKNDVFNINSQFISDKLNIRQLREYTQYYRIIFKDSINQTYVDKFFSFIQAIHNCSMENEEIQINIVLKQCQYIERLLIPIDVCYNTIIFNKLLIVRTNLTIFEQETFPLLLLFPLIHLKDSSFGPLFKKQVKSYINSQNQSIAPFLNLRELRVNNCQFTGSRMLDNLKQLEVHKMNSMTINETSKQLLENQEFTQNLKSITSLNIIDKDDLYVYYFDNSIGIDYYFKFLRQTFQDLQKLKEHQVCQSIENILKFAQNLEFPEINLVIKFDQSITLYEYQNQLILMEGISVFIQVQRKSQNNDLKQFNQDERKDIVTIEFIEKMDTFLEQFNISVQQLQNDNSTELGTLLEFTKTIDEQIRRISFQMRKLESTNQDLKFTISIETF